MAGRLVQTSDPEMSRLLGAGNSALIVTGLMLPVGGVIARFVAAAFDAGFANPLQLASTLPPGELATTGAMPVLTIAVTFVGSLLAVRAFRRIEGAPDLLFDRRFLLVMAGALGFGLLVLDAPYVGLGSAATSIFLFLVAAWLGIREAVAGPDTTTDGPGPIRGGRLALALVLTYGLAAVAYGFGGRLGPAGDVATRDPASLPAGPYIRVAEDADWLFLAPCRSRGTVLQVPKGAVESITWLEPGIRTDLSESDVYRVCPQ